MTDEQIVKALECCGKMKECKKECPLGDVGGIDKCIHTLMLDALDLIKRLQFELSEEKAKGDICAEVIARQDREIERLQGYNNNLIKANTALSNEILDIKAEAVREFAERLKAGASRIQIGGKYDYEMVTTNYIDYLVKEMMEGGAEG